jgi:hypothetical protein
MQVMWMIIGSVLIRGGTVSLLPRILHYRIYDIDATFTKYPIHVDENAFDSGIRVISHEVVTEG